MTHVLQYMGHNGKDSRDCSVSCIHKTSTPSYDASVLSLQDIFFHAYTNITLYMKSDAIVWHLSSLTIADIAIFKTHWSWVIPLKQNWNTNDNFEEMTPNKPKKLVIYTVRLPKHQKQL